MNGDVPDSRIIKLPLLRDIIGRIQIRKRSISWDNVDWPIGAAMLWYGAAADIPAGWAICNGATVNGFATPDMTDAYPKGVVAGVVGGTGGANTHILSVAEMPAHTHTIAAQITYPGVAGIITILGGAGTVTSNATGGGGAHNNEPKYVRFYYIVYVGE